MSLKTMGVTTAKCFICGHGAIVKFLSPRPSRRNLLGEWRKQWSMSLCHVLQLSDSFQSIFNEASFCFNCQEAVCRAEFTVNAISRLQNEIGVIREELKGNFQSHYENLMQGRTELDTTGNEYDKTMEEIIKEIAIKGEPVEETVDHVLDNLEEQEIVIPGVELMHEDEFPTPGGFHLLEDPLKISSEVKFLETAFQQSETEEDYSFILSTPLPSKPSFMRQRQSFVTGCGKNNKSGVNSKETSKNSSDSNSVFEESEDSYVSGNKMIEDDKGIAEPKTPNLDAIKCHPDGIEKPNLTRYSTELNSWRYVQLLENRRENGKKDSRKQSFRGQNAVKMEFIPADPLKSQVPIIPGITKLNLTCNHESCRANKLEFKFQREVREHILNRHAGLDVDKLFHCPHCPEQYARLIPLHNHVESVHSGGYSLPLVLSNNIWTLNCSICLKGFNEESALKEHEILHVSDTPHACVLCSEQNLNSAAHLRRHVQSAHDGKKYWCNMEPCLSSFVAFSLPREMKSHYASVHSEENNQRIYHCTECPSRFSVASYLAVHSKTHNNTPRSCLCVFCGKTFGSEEAVKRHASTFHTKLELKPKCAHCTKSFDGVAEMEEHESLHSKESPFTCILCDKVLSCTTHLQRHVANSHEIWEFECSVEGCDAKFPTKPRLKWHHRTSHGGVTKRFECPHCPLRFYAPSGLKTHMFVHTGERPHSCPIAGCGRKFINKSKLNKHIQNLHEPVPENKFECRLCGKRFRIRERLSLHEVTHGDARPFMCDICPATCKTRKSLTSHMKTHRKTIGTNLKVQRQRKKRIPIRRSQV